MGYGYVYLTCVTKDFEVLSDALNAELWELFGQAQKKYQQYNFLDGIKDVFLCFDGELPVACAAMKPYGEGTYEVKRVFVLQAYRGKGISARLMGELEAKASVMGIRRLILETGHALTAAVGLYRKLGYRVIENYGQYAGMTESLCMEKYLQ